MLTRQCSARAARTAPRAVPSMTNAVIVPYALTQAQRDFFGAHTYQRVDRPDGKLVHTDRRSVIEHSTPGEL